MASVIIVGTQWGDEGKGKIVDYLAENCEYVVRSQGGSNAGHTVVVDNVKYKLRLLPSGILHKNKVCVIGGGAGCAIALPVARALHENGAKVTSIVGFRNKDLVILEDEFKEVSDEYILMSDDGSVGTKGLVTNALEELLKKGEKFDRVICIGPLIMMKFVCLLTKKYNVKTVVSMNPIMIDGTGMCGCCRLTVGGKVKFACVDGPDFDGHEVDFDEAINRNKMYRDFERKKYEETCNLFKKEVK